MRQYKVGDRVQIVDCAHPIWEPKDESPGWMRSDLSPQLVGIMGTIIILSNNEVQNLGRGVGIKFDNGLFVAWFYNWQLKLVEKAEYRILMKFCEYVGNNGYHINGYDNGQLDTIITNFLNEQDGDREQAM